MKARDLATGVERVDVPRENLRFGEIGIHPGGAQWTSWIGPDVTSVTLKAWSAASGATTEIAALPALISLASDGSEAFLVDDAGSIVAYPVGGGSARVMASVDAQRSAGSSYQIIDADAAEVFVIDGAAIRAFGKGDGRARDLGPFLGGEHWSSVTFDGESFFFEGTSVADVSVYAKGSGVFSPLDTGLDYRDVRGVAVDACNVYLAVGNPPAVVALAK